jgi:D-arginine dehydrogenase
MEHFECVVVGGGAAGAAVAYEMSRFGKVVLIERESGLGYHSTGRSAAVISENYGPSMWQVLVSASRPFFEQPPPGFATHSLLHRIGALYFGTLDQEPDLLACRYELERRNVACKLMAAADAASLAPSVRTELFSTALYEPGCADIDANALLQGYVRAGRARGLRVMMATGVTGLERRGGLWHLHTSTASVTASRVVNAAGAWADDLALLAGIQPKGLQPYRRTAILIDPPASADVRRWPMTFDMSETWYFKPESGRVMVSPVDKTPTPPCDAAPDEYDVAVAADRIERATTMTVGRIYRSWAGLRTFASDEQPVIGPDSDDPTFVWLAGQGGNGVMGAPAAAQLAAALGMGEAPPRFVEEYPLELDLVLPSRLV